jgi:imidazole glycerol phosphate synthase subunit HisF
MIRVEDYWYQYTVKGGREGRDVDALQLAQTCEKLSAGKVGHFSEVFEKTDVEAALAADCLHLLPQQA